MKTFLFAIVLLTFIPLQITAQKDIDSTIVNHKDSIMLLAVQDAVNKYDPVPDIPPSPQAAAFNRLGNYETRNNYGAPDISIPLYEIDFHGYKIPLVLHYEASPQRSGYNYDVTGLGWTLSGNSCISRTIRDRADEYGYWNNPFELDSFDDHTGHSRRFIDCMGSLEYMNFQYDTYDIVLPTGRTIPFYMYKENGVLTYKLLELDRNVKITCSYTNSIDSFTVTEENGITYRFTIPETATNSLEDNVNAHKNVTWLLSQIDIPAKGSISYEYTQPQSFTCNTIDDPVIRIKRFNSHTLEDSTEIGYEFLSYQQQYSPTYAMRFIRRISYGPTTLNFNYAPDGRHMNSFEIIDDVQTIRRYNFSINGSALTSLVISGNNDQDCLTYGFNYTSNAPGSKTDYWGNRCHSNASTDIGNFNIYVERNGLSEEYLQRYNNSANNIVKAINEEKGYFKLKLMSSNKNELYYTSSPSMHMILSKITYPNGGSTTFVYENHKFLTATDVDGDIVFDRRRQRIIEGGGFRIKSIANWTADGNLAGEEHYRYGFTYGDIHERNFPLPLPRTYNQDYHIGCGEPVVDPNILTFLNYSYSPIRLDGGFKEMIIGKESPFKNVPVGDGGPWWWEASFSSNRFRGLLAGRRPVVYPEVTVYHGNPDIPESCTGKTVYKYDIYDNVIDGSRYYMSCFNHSLSLDTAYCEPLYYISSEAPGMACFENPDKRHQLKSMQVYSYDAGNDLWSLTSEVNYAYKEETMMQNGYVYNSEISLGHCYRHSINTGTAGAIDWYPLYRFYSPVVQRRGRSTLSGTETTILRVGSIRQPGNTLKEHTGYRYYGVPYYRDYTDLYDMHDALTYVGEQRNTSDAIIADMKSRNMLSSLLRMETTSADYDSPVLAGKKIEYGYFNGTAILPSKIYELNGEEYEETLQILSYDQYGNPTETLDLKTNMHTIYVWGWSGRYIMASIKSTESLQMPSISPYANDDTSYSLYIQLSNQLDNVQIQTWKYKPLVGVTSFTDVNGQTTVYEYDGLGRLKRESRMVNGTTMETLHEYEYNYLNQ